MQYLPVRYSWYLPKLDTHGVFLYWIHMISTPFRYTHPSPFFFSSSLSVLLCENNKGLLGGVWRHIACGVMYVWANITSASDTHAPPPVTWYLNYKNFQHLEISTVDIFSTHVCTWTYVVNKHKCMWVWRKKKFVYFFVFSSNFVKCFS